MSDAADLVATVFSMLSTANDDGSPPPGRLVRAALWTLAHSAFVEALRAELPERGALAELAELDPAARALVTASEAGRTALAADLEDVRAGRDGLPALTLRRDLDSEDGR